MFEYEHNRNIRTCALAAVDPLAVRFDTAGTLATLESNKMLGTGYKKNSQCI